MLGTALGIGQSAASLGLQAGQARKQREHERAMAEYAYNKDLDMWNRQNAYNSPQAQMERLQAAGLNPNMVYGQGTVAGNTSSQMPKYNAPRQNFNVQMPNVVGTISQFQDLEVKQAQTDLLKAQADLTTERSGTEAARGVLLGYEGRYANRYYNNRSWKMNYDHQKSVADMQIANFKVQTMEEEWSQMMRDRRAKTEYQEFRNEMNRLGMGKVPWEAELSYMIMKERGLDTRNIIAGSAVMKETAKIVAGLRIPKAISQIGKGRKSSFNKQRQGSRPYYDPNKFQGSYRWPQGNFNNPTYMK